MVVASTKSDRRLVKNNQKSRGNSGGHGQSQMKDLDEDKLSEWSASPAPKNCSEGSGGNENWR